MSHISDNIDEDDGVHIAAYEIALVAFLGPNWRTDEHLFDEEKEVASEFASRVAAGRSIDHASECLFWSIPDEYKAAIERYR